MRKSGVSYNQRRRDIWREIKQFERNLKHCSHTFFSRKVWDREVTARQARRLVLALSTRNAKRSWFDVSNKPVSYHKSIVTFCPLRLHQSVSVAAAVNSSLGSPCEPVRTSWSTPASVAKFFERFRRFASKVVLLTDDEVKQIHEHGQLGQTTLRTWLITYVVFKHKLSLDDAAKIFNVMRTTPVLALGDCQHLMASSFTAGRLADLRESADYLAKLVQGCKKESRT